MAEKLTPNGVHQLIESEGHFLGRDGPTLQIVSIRRVPANALTDVYWVSGRSGRMTYYNDDDNDAPCSVPFVVFSLQAVLSDGQHSLEAVISTQLCQWVRSGRLVERALVAIESYQYNVTDDDIHIVSVMAAHVLDGVPDEVIGRPTSVLDRVRRREAQDDGGGGGGGRYFDDDDDDDYGPWDAAAAAGEEQPLTWSADRPGDPFCDWSIEVARADSNSDSDSDSDSDSGKRQTYHVHKAILSVGPRRSDYFAALFRQPSLAEHATRTSRISLPASAADVFPAVLDYVYHDRPVPLASRNAAAVRHLARYFAIRSLWKLASAFVKSDFSLDTAAVYLSESLLYRDERLETAAVDLLASRMEELRRRTLAQLSPSSFEKIVTSPKLKCRSKRLSDIVLQYCRTRRDDDDDDAVDVSLLLHWTRSDRMPSVSRKAALPLLELVVRGERPGDAHHADANADANRSEDSNVLRARCIETCVEEWKETLAKPLLALESRDKNITRILGAHSIEHRDLPLHVQVELLEKALCAAKIELDDVKAELLYREEQVEEMTKRGGGTGRGE
ncbi:hypothetical protein ACHAXS_003661 [Conticribra weissflogii]